MTSFKSFHPLTNLLYFAFIITFSMFVMHPVFIFISFFNAFLYTVLLKGVKTIKFNLLLIISFIFIGLVVNSLFNHTGVTILFYFKNSTPFTLESVIYGVASAGMILTVVFWFSCLNEVITDDKIIYLFGRIVPSLSLIISMIFRFVPKFKNQYKLVMNSQKAFGMDVDNKAFIDKIKLAIKVLSIMISWTMENAIDTADSMRSRGYGIKNRTSFHLYKFELRDYALSTFILVCSALVLALMQHNFVYFPIITKISINLQELISYMLFSLICIFPSILEIREVLKWR